MGKNQPLLLSEEEKKELSIGLLREWWITATQAVVDSVGSENALSSMKPYFIHAGKAGGIMFQKLAGIPGNDPFTSANGMGFAFAVMMDTKWGPSWRANDGSVIGEFHGCVTKGQCKEACICCCKFSIPTSHMETSPDFEMRLDKSLAFGDTHCEWLISRKNFIPEVSHTERFLIPDEVLEAFAPSIELQYYLSHAWSGEFWVIATRSFIDLVGPDKALERLRFYMRHSGMSLGFRLSNQLMLHERRKESMVKIIELIQQLHQRKWDLMNTMDSAEATIHECPFASGAPPEVCSQYEAFFNGICEVLDPEYEFTYDRMMTKGDKTCHWTIRKRGESSKMKDEEAGLSEDPGKILAIRYAKGEITKEELEERIKNLRKLSLV